MQAPMRAYHAAVARDTAKGKVYGTSPRSEAPLVAPRWRPLNPSSKIPESVAVKREKTVDKVRGIIRRKWGEDYDVELFGSTQYGVDKPTSDLDLVIVDAKRKNGFPPTLDLNELPEIYNIKSISRLFGRRGFKRVIPINAAVPIVKFYDIETNLHCDLNVNDRLGVVNTMMMKHYCELSPILRPVITTIKAWAKRLGLNHPTSRKGQPVTFNSYCLGLMAIGFLQMKGALPNLQENLDQVPEDELLTHDDVFWMRTKAGERIPCNVRWNEYPEWPRKPLPRNPRRVEMLVAQVMEEWFAFWGNQFDYRKSILSIRDGGIIPRKRPPTAERQATPKPQFVRAPSYPDQPQLEQDVAGNLGRPSDNVLIASMPRPGAARFGSGGQHDMMVNALSDTWDNAEKWRHDTLSVADPFIRQKNVAQSVSEESIKRFRSDCRQAHMFLMREGTLGDLLGARSSFLSRH